MAWDLRQLRFFATAAEHGSFTEAAARLHVSQAAVSRTIASLETAVGQRLLRRIPRGCELTGAGAQLLPHALRVLAEADRFTEYLYSRRGLLRLGYAWAALGEHTPHLQREWAARHPDVDLELVRHNSPTAGLAEGWCDVAVVRIPIEDPRFVSVVVGLERRVVAFASDDAAWSRRRQLTMAEIAERTVLTDPRVGTTGSHLWRGAEREPEMVEVGDVDAWLDGIAAGRGVGTSSEATAHHHSRSGVRYRPIKGDVRIAVSLLWWRDDRPPGLADLVEEVARLYAG